MPQALVLSQLFNSPLILPVTKFIGLGRTEGGEELRENIEGTMGVASLCPLGFPFQGAELDGCLGLEGQAEASLKMENVNSSL